MPVTQATANEAAAALLAIVVVANGRIDDRELAELDRLRAYDRLGIGRDHFMALARSALEELGGSLSQSQSPRLNDRLHLLAWQHALVDPGLRLLVCSLSAAVITADGRVTAEERLVHRWLLSQWEVSETMVAHAIMKERGH